jgi:uncharacterized surface protein with fasciclin (FAS1) repeats
MKARILVVCAVLALAAASHISGQTNAQTSDSMDNMKMNAPMDSMHGSMKDPMVGGAAMYPTKDIVDNAVNSNDHTTLVAAVKAAGLVDTLKGPGPFTVFAPTNEAFAKLPAGTVDTLLKPEHKATLTKILTYHVVSGRVSAQDLKKQIMAGEGQATLKTVSGGTLVATEKNGKIMLRDEKGGMATVTIGNVFQSNGVIHVVDTVLMPN